MFKDLHTLSLNEGQTNATEAFFEFLLDPTQKELHISGPGGVGKTFTMSHMIDEVIPRYEDTCRLMGVDPLYKEVVMCATTNKAAAVLAQATGRPTGTVHSIFHLYVKSNFNTGEQDLVQKKTWQPIKDTIVFIDEGSMVDWKLLKYVRESLINSKIVWVSDHCQLPPVKEEFSPIYKGELNMYELTQPMRNNGQPALMALCDQVRQTVIDGKFNPIQIVPGVVDLFDGPQMEAQFRKDMIQQNQNQRILCYTNARVNQYNDYLRELRQLPAMFQVGEVVVNNSNVEIGKGKRIAVEEELTILRIEPESRMIDMGDDVMLEVLDMDLASSYETYISVPVPVNRQHFDQLKKYYGRVKNWDKYFFMSERIADLRPFDACTVHKAQGSTYDTAYIDLTDISECRNPTVAARLLYVAVSRARNRIIMYGNLASKFGGLILP